MVTSFIVTEKLKFCMVTEKLTWSFKQFSGCGEEEENFP
jgi:hypothetical protein